LSDTSASESDDDGGVGEGAGGGGGAAKAGAEGGRAVGVTVAAGASTAFTWTSAKKGRMRESEMKAIALDPNCVVGALGFKCDCLMARENGQACLARAGTTYHNVALARKTNWKLTLAQQKRSWAVSFRAALDPSRKLPFRVLNTPVCSASFAEFHAVSMSLVEGARVLAKNADLDLSEEAHSRVKGVRSNVKEADNQRQAGVRVFLETLASGKTEVGGAVPGVGIGECKVEGMMARPPSAVHKRTAMVLPLRSKRLVYLLYRVAVENPYSRSHFYKVWRKECKHVHRARKTENFSNVSSGNAVVGRILLNMFCVLQ